VGKVQITTIQSQYKRIFFLGFTNFGNCFNHCRISSVFIKPESEIKHWIPPEASHYSSVSKILTWNSMADGTKVLVAHMQHPIVTASFLTSDKPFAINQLPLYKTTFVSSINSAHITANKLTGTENFCSSKTT